MAKISKVLRNVENNGLLFYCPGCKFNHLIYYGNSNKPRWNWNNNKDQPTFNPSIKVSYSIYEDNKEIPKLCHSFITNGKIQFLMDCTHELRGQTVDMAEID